MRREHIVQAVAGALLFGLLIAGCVTGPDNSLFPFTGVGTSKFAFVVNDSDVSAFTVDASSGSLTLVPGSPFGVSTGDPDYASSDPLGRFLYVADPTNAVILGFIINQSTGALSPIPGSPFPALPDVEVPLVDTTGKFLFVSDDSVAGDVEVFRIGSNGALTLVPGSPFPTGFGPKGMAVHPNGKFLFVTNTDAGSISVFTIDPASGALAQITGSPFTVDPLALGVQPAFLAVHPNGKFLYVTETEANTVLGFSINPATGALTALAGSPFASGVQPQGIDVDSKGKFLFVANHGDTDGDPVIDGSISVYAIDAAGSLTPVTGSPFTVAGGNPLMLSVDVSNKFLYVTNDDLDDVLAFSIGATGAVTPLTGSPFATTGSTGPTGIVLTPRPFGPGT
jgi:6-phosphogluconolactonase